MTPRARPEILALEVCPVHWPAEGEAVSIALAQRHVLVLWMTTQLFSYPPPSKNITGSFVSGINLGLPEKSGMWLPK